LSPVFKKVLAKMLRVATMWHGRDNWQKWLALCCKLSSIGLGRDLTQKLGPLCIQETLDQQEKV